ncbi:hypothetical protein V3F56_03245 [Moorellaceae bacterium AZ2]
MVNAFWALKTAVRRVLKDERGSLPEMTWVIGAALVVAAIIVLALVFAPQTAQNFWNAATNYIRSQFGF